MGFRQGYYTPQNPKKYRGDITKIRYLSSWEYKFNQFLDSNPNVLEWSSECIAIPYLKPTDRRVHKYYPDYYIKYKDKNGNIKQEIIEVKPKKQTRRSRSKNPKTRLYEDITYAINMAKWDACQNFCNKYNIKFRILTEQELFR